MIPHKSDGRPTESDFQTRQGSVAKFDFAGILEAAPDAMIVTDQSGKMVLVNTETEKLFFYSRAELLNQPIEIMMPQRFRGQHQGLRTGFFAAPRVRPMGAGLELPGMRKDGTEFPVEISLSPLRTEQGLFVIAVIRDVTEKRAEQERLARHAEKITQQAELLDLAHDLIFVKDMENHILFWNRGAEEAYGWSKAEAEGSKTNELLQTVFPEPLQELEQKVLSRGHWEGELIHTTRQGSRVIVASRWALKRSKAGEPEGILEINTDITARKRAEDHVRLLNRDLMRRSAELEASNKELEAFTYSVSHDLRAPLRHIAGFSTLLLEEHSPQLAGDTQRYLQLIQEGTRQMGRLVDDLLNMGRVGRRELRVRVTGLKTIVEEVIKELDEDTPQRSIQWNIAPLPFVECDPALMKQVFANLLSNAVKFTRPREHATIEVGATNGDGSPTVFVRDNGVGFSMKYADKLFGIFQRLHRVEDFEGTGVGLATVQRIIHKHGGRIWAEAEVNKGATFYFKVGDGNGQKDGPTLFEEAAGDARAD